MTAPQRSRVFATAAVADPNEYTPHYAYRLVGAAGKSRNSERNSSGKAVREQVLHCEGVALDRIAGAVGTPAYVYSRASVEDAYRRLDRAFGALPHSICYAVKANSNLALLRVLARLGSSFDIVSGGELDRLRRVGVRGRRIVFSGVGKTRDEIREALRYPGRAGRRASGRTARCGILLFNIESEAELEVLLDESAEHVAEGGQPPAVAIRVNPDVLAGGHRHISTGHHQHKFGVDWEQAKRLYLAHKGSRWISWRGISAHIGSQILTVAPYRSALQRVASYVRELAAQGIRLDYLDIGGGLGIRYTDEQPLDLKIYARTLAGIVKPLGCRLLIEPGRALVGPAGVLLTRVIYLKENALKENGLKANGAKANGGKTFVIVDAAMNDLIRPVLYEAVHPITKVVRSAGTTAKNRVDVVGPICESGDFLALDWPLEPVAPGDLLAVWAAGAYSFVESSNYNARRRAPEVLVEGSRFRIARTRQTYDDLVRGESL